MRNKTKKNRIRKKIGGAWPSLSNVKNFGNKGISTVKSFVPWSNTNKTTKSKTDLTDAIDNLKIIEGTFNCGDQFKGDFGYQLTDGQLTLVPRINNERLHGFIWDQIYKTYHKYKLTSRTTDHGIPESVGITIAKNKFVLNNGILNNDEELERLIFQNFQFNITQFNFKTFNDITIQK